MRRSSSRLKFAFSFLAAIQFLAPLAAPAVVVLGNTADFEAREDGTFGIGNPSDTVGARFMTSSTNGAASIYIFALPVLSSGDVISDATFTFRLNSKSGTPAFNVDLYGVGFFGSAGTQAGLYFEGANDSNYTKLQDNIITNSTPLGAVSTNSGGSLNLGAYLNSFYTANPSYAGGSYVYLRVNPDAAPPDAGPVRYLVEKVESVNADPMLNITVVPEPSVPGLLGLGLAAMVLARQRRRRLG